MTPEQCRAARAWLDWSQDDLARAASVGLSTVRDFEKGRRVPIANNLAAMRVALEARGARFVGDGGETLGIEFRKEPA
ncbi:helix-turn-helix domain-containing protein [Xanthobacter sp. V7C-4]|uniref:helix-turn-helix domain-containing protein n=1 Tax=Xanthobacter autotrophicus (strain ATCC BAA-1158 / Py2) TaxID=78245 RepID=UPI003729BB6C